LINVDFADVKTIMKDAGTALLGIGTGVGENRAQMAARAAISSPLLDLSIEGATGVLFNVTGGNDLTMFEVDEAARIISSSADTDANIIFGAVVREDLADQIRITVVATGFDETRARIAQFAQPQTEPTIQGVVSEGPKSDSEGEEDEERHRDDRRGGDDLPPGEGEEDVFGEKFEIPAFLRKIN
jgi:cell division protein FtsZ